VELHLQDEIRRWRYGEGVNWQKEFVTRFIQPVNIDGRGREPAVFIELKQRPGDGAITTGLKASVFLYMADGGALEFRGSKIFDTGHGNSLLKLQQVTSQDKGSKTTDGALIAKSPGIPSDASAGRALFYSRLWRPGQKLTVAFRGGSVEIRRRTAQIASEWTKCANLSFDFGANPANPNEAAFYEWPAPDGKKVYDIRIGFGDANYSTIGTDSASAAALPTEPSMSLVQSFFDTDMFQFSVLHEFGHALGLQHVHSHPDADPDFRWDDDAGYVLTKDEFGRPIVDPEGRRPGAYSLLGYFGSREQVDLNLRPNASNWMPLKPTPDSVMMYAYQAEFFVNGRESPWFREKPRTSLSDYDRQLIQLIYPRPGGIQGEHAIVEKAKEQLLSREKGPVKSAEPNIGDYDLTRHWKILPPKPSNKELEAAADPQLGLPWARDFETSRHYVCRIMARTDFNHPVLGLVRANQSFGTCILVSPSLVLTCNHVIPSAQVARSCDIVFEGDVHFQLANSTPVHSSPIGELDFSLVRVKTGDDGAPPGRRQGFYALITSDQNRDSLYSFALNVNLIHYPRGQTTPAFEVRGKTLKLTGDRFVAYDGNVEGGSSGAPVFNDSWWIIALHRGKNQADDEPNEFHKIYAKAVRIDLIIDSIRKNCDRAVLSDLSLLSDKS
jgi:hypothetical protein